MLRTVPGRMGAIEVLAIIVTVVIEVAMGVSLACILYVFQECSGIQPCAYMLYGVVSGCGQMLNICLGTWYMD